MTDCRSRKALALGHSRPASSLVDAPMASRHSRMSREVRKRNARLKPSPVPAVTVVRMTVSMPLDVERSLDGVDDCLEQRKLADTPAQLVFEGLLAGNVSGGYCTAEEFAFPVANHGDGDLDRHGAAVPALECRLVVLNDDRVVQSVRGWLWRRGRLVRVRHHQIGALAEDLRRGPPQKDLCAAVPERDAAFAVKEEERIGGLIYDALTQPARFLRRGSAFGAWVLLVVRVAHRPPPQWPW